MRAAFIVLGLLAGCIASAPDPVCDRLCPLCIPEAVCPEGWEPACSDEGHGTDPDPHVPDYPSCATDVPTCPEGAGAAICR